MAIDPDNTVRVAFRGLCFGQRIILDLSYVCTVGSGAADEVILDELIDSLRGGAFDIQDSYLACLPPQYTLEEIRAQVVFPVRKAYWSQFPIAKVGTNAANASVSNDAAAITRRTLKSGRNQISTLKIGPAPDSVSVAGVLTDAYRVLLNTLALQSIKTVVLPVTTAQFVPNILTKTTNAGTDRFMRTFRIGRYSRVNRRRTVGVGE